MFGTGPDPRRGLVRDGAVARHERRRAASERPDAMGALRIRAEMQSGRELGDLGRLVLEVVATADVGLSGVGVAVLVAAQLADLELTHLQVS